MQTRKAEKTKGRSSYQPEGKLFTFFLWGSGKGEKEVEVTESVARRKKVVEGPGRCKQKKKKNPIRKGRWGGGGHAERGA